MISGDKRKADRHWTANIVVAIALLAGAISLTSPTVAHESDKGRWVATWGNSASHAGPAPTNQTVRQIESISLGGGTFRVRLSNEFSPQAITVGEAHVALAGPGSSIKPGTDRQLTFAGQSSIIIPSNAVVYTDPVQLKVPALGDVAVSIFFPTNTGTVSLHDASIDTAYITSGNTTSAVSLSGATTSPSRFMLSEIQVLADDDAAAIVTLGDSITEGVGSTNGASRRWPDFLANRLTAAHGIGSRGVDNAGIGGNRVLHDTPPNPFGLNFGQGALARLDRDVLSQAGVKYLIILEGVNDLGLPGFVNVPQETITADQLIGAYRQIIARAHAHGIKVIGGTITPFANSTEPNYWTPAGEAIRQAANKFILHSGEFDGAIDFASAIADPKNPTFMLTKYSSGDNLHPNDAGYEAMADAIDLRLFKQGLDKFADRN